MNQRGRFRRRRTARHDVTGPAQVDDMWTDPHSGTQTRSEGLFARFVQTWQRRIGGVGRVLRWAAGVESRSESRAVTSLPWVQGGFGGSSLTVERALRLGPVFAAGRLLASNVASMPLQTYRKLGERRERIPNPSLLVQPDPQGTLFDWVFRAMTSLVYRGNAVGFIATRNFEEFPTTIIWLDPDQVQVIDSNPIPGAPGSYTNPTWYYNGRVIPAESILHIPWFTVAGRIWGLSPMAAYATTVATGLAAEKYSKDWFDSGGVPPGTFANANQKVNQKEADILKARLVSAIRSHEPIVYGKDWTYNPITISPHEAQFIDTMRLTASQIAAIYGIPPEMIGGETGASMTYQNVEQQSINFVQFTLLPWITKLEAALSQLLPRGQYVKFNVDALIRPDAETRFRNHATARVIGLRSIDEIRALEDEAPLPNGAGQDYTPLPILAGQQVRVPQVRGDGLSLDIPQMSLDDLRKETSNGRSGQHHHS